MARWTGTWLSGPGSAGVDLWAEGDYRGRRLGLPQEGPGSAAAFSTRLVALVLDILAGALIGQLVIAVVGIGDPLLRSVAANGAFAVQVLVLIALTGQSIGMRLTGLRVLQLGSTSAVPGLLPAAIRTALLLLLIPAIISDRDGRGLHDKAARTVVVRA